MHLKLSLKKGSLQFILTLNYIKETAGLRVTRLSDTILSGYSWMGNNTWKELCCYSGKNAH